MADQFGSIAQAGAYMMNAGLDAMSQRKKLQLEQEEAEKDRIFRAAEAEKTRQASAREAQLDRENKIALNRDMSEAEKMMLERKLQSGESESQKDRDWKTQELLNDRGIDQQRADSDTLRANQERRKMDIEEAKFKRDDPANFRADAEYTIGAFQDLAARMRINQANLKKAVASGEPEDSVYMIGLLSEKDALDAFMARKGGSLFGTKYRLEVDTATGSEKIVSDQVSLNDILSIRTHLGQGAAGGSGQAKVSSEDLLRSTMQGMPKSSARPSSSYQTTPPPSSYMPRTGADPFGFDTEAGASQESTPSRQVPDDVDEVIDERRGKRETIQSKSMKRTMDKEKAKKELENLKSAGKYQIGGRDSAMGRKADAEKRRRMAELEAILSE